MPVPCVIMVLTHVPVLSFLTCISPLFFQLLLMFLITVFRVCGQVYTKYTCFVSHQVACTSPLFIKNIMTFFLNNLNYNSVAKLN